MRCQMLVSTIERKKKKKKKSLRFSLWNLGKGRCDFEFNAMPLEYQIEDGRRYIAAAKEVT